MVTVGDAEDSVYQGLQSLPWRVYLVAMWILCGELQTLYAPWIHEADRPLMASTMDLIRDVVIVGESDGTARRGREVARGWGRVIRTRDSAAVSGGAAECVGNLRRAGAGDRRPSREGRRGAMGDGRGHGAMAGLGPAGSDLGEPGAG